MKRLTFPNLLAAVLVVLLAIGMTACGETPTSANDDDVAEATSDAEQIASDLSQELALSSEQQANLQGAMDRHGPRMRAPGALWYLAAELQATLTEEQKERLLSRAEQGIGRFGPGGPFGGPGGPGHGRLGRGHGPGGNDCFAENVPEDVQAAIEALRETYRPQIEALIEQRRSGEITDEAFRAQMEALRDTLKAEVDALLTDDVKAALEACIEEQRAEREAERAERQADERVAMSEVLGLSGDLETAVFDLLDNTSAEAEAIREQVQDGTLDREAAREALAALRETTATALEDLLDDTQWEIVQIHHALAARGPKGGPGGRRGGPGGPGFGGGPGGPGFGGGPTGG